MSHNRFGHLFQVMTFGESHGPAIGCVVDGCPPRVPVRMDVVQAALDRRRPGQSRYTTQRREPDRVRLLSGVLPTESESEAYLTTGTPIAMLIDNLDARPRDYDHVADRFRPGHADFTYQAKYGIRDVRGGGRSSARETATRVAAGAVAQCVLDHVLEPRVIVRGAVVRIGDLAVDPDRWHWECVDSNPFFCPDPGRVEDWRDRIDRVRKAGSSVGAVVEVRAQGVPAGWGAPVYAKLDTDIAAAMMSINAVKGVEIGAGFESASLQGEENADEILPGPRFASNAAGGILGGISTGQEIVCRFAVKPPSSIRRPLRTIDAAGRETEISTQGRHDPCVGIRAVPVGEAMMRCVLLDHFLRHRAQIGADVPVRAR